jgi:hypothetical protein
MMRQRLFASLLIVAALIWAGTVAAAYRAIRRFETTPGPAATGPPNWPASSGVARSDGSWSLVMLVHPHCSCSRASVQELAEIVKNAPRHVETTVLVYRPHEMAPGWERTAVYTAAKQVRGVRVVVDRDGEAARTFGGFTSGQTFLYDGEGRLRFSGGITSLRGHAGINRGRLDILRIARSRSGSGKHPVFGCAIQTAEGKAQ